MKEYYITYQTKDCKEICNENIIIPDVDKPKDYALGRALELYKRPYYITIKEVMKDGELSEEEEIY